MPAAAVAKPILYEYPKTDKHIEAAVRRGVAYLKKVEDYRVGARALAGLTLLSCGVSAKDPAVVRAAKSVRAGLPQLSATYELSLCVLFLDKLGDPKDKKWIRRIAVQLMAGQGILGGWNYQCHVLNAQQDKRIADSLKAPIRRAPAGQVFAPGPAGDIRFLPALFYRPGQDLRFQAHGWEDNSITQFVILALWTARRHGVPVERSLAMVEARFRASQFPDGCWAYKWNPLQGGFRADSMTCAGLLGLAVANGNYQGLVEKTASTGTRMAVKGEAPKLKRDAAIDRALAFLGQRIGGAGLKQVVADKVKANVQLIVLQKQLAVAGIAQRPAILKQIQDIMKDQNNTQLGGTILGANARGDLCFLWSLERVAVTYDLRTIGGKDWYAWGAPLILANQHADGSWNDFFPGVPDTCFALLFLNRTNVVQDLTRQLQYLPLSREAALRLSDPYQSASPGQLAALAQKKGR
jgi:hypothetical protein